jgi:uncharacterized protein (UPF0332 family)
MAETLHDQLLEQAQHLVQRDRKRPRQASLRRAISAAYYALFHCLVASATAELVGTNKDRRALRTMLARSYTHTGMAKVCQAFACAGTPPKHLKPVFDQEKPSAEIQSVATAFRELQEAREEADYNPYHMVSRTEAELLVEQARDALRAWDDVPDGLVRRAFLIAMLLGEGRR